MTAKQWRTLADQQQRIADRLYGADEDRLTSNAEALARLLYQRADAEESKSMARQIGRSAKREQS